MDRTRRVLMGMVAGLLSLNVWTARVAAQPVPPTTPYSRFLLGATNSAQARERLEVSAGGTNQDSILKTNGQGFGTTALQQLQVTTGSGQFQNGLYLLGGTLAFLPLGDGLGFQMLRIDGPGNVTATKDGSFLNMPQASLTNHGELGTNDFAAGRSEPFQLRSSGQAFRTPILGIGNWYGAFAASESGGKIMADFALTNGHYAAGYRYIIFDGLWTTNRDGNGNLVPRPEMNGLTNLATYIHARGMKLGLYLTDGGVPGHPDTDLAHIERDVQQLSSWYGVDYIKFDGANPHVEYEVARVASILATNNRPVFLQVGAPSDGVTASIVAKANSVRRLVGGDITSFQTLLDWLDDIESSGRRRWSAPGSFIDLDYIDGSALTTAEMYSHFVMQAMVSSPLYASDFTADSAWIFTNIDIINIDQDPFVVAASRVLQTNSCDVWLKPMAGGTNAIAVLNRSAVFTNATINFSNFVENSPWRKLSTANDLLWTLYDCRSNSIVGYITNSTLVITNLPAHGTFVYTLLPGLVTPFRPGTNYISDYHWMPVYTNGGFLDAVSPTVPIGRDSNDIGGTLTLAGVTYAKGLGTRAHSWVKYFLGGAASTFHASFGIDDRISSGSDVTFNVLKDGVQVFSSGVMTFNTATVTTNLDMTGCQVLTIWADGGASLANDAADIADAYVVVPYSGAFAGAFAGDGSGLTALPARLQLEANTVDLYTNSWVFANANGGDAALGSRVLVLRANTTANGRSSLVWPGTAGDDPAGLASDGENGIQINWSKPFWMTVKLGIDASTFSANGFFRVALGHNQGVTSGLLAQKGFGFHITGSYGLSALAHNGSSLTTTSTGVSVSHALGTTMHTITALSTGTGFVTLWLDGTLVGTYPGGPTGQSTDEKTIMVAEVNNGGDTTQNYVRVMSPVRLRWGN